MDVRGGSAVLSEFDTGMLFQRVFGVNDRGLPSDQEDGLGIIQRPHLIRSQQLFATMSSDEFKKGQKISPLH